MVALAISRDPAQARWMSKLEEPRITHLFRNRRNRIDQRRKTNDQAHDASTAHRLFDAVQVILSSLVLRLSSRIFCLSSFVVYQGGHLN
jgi:hypothetical protein